mmetsp:Transcript_21261/g.22677  ORF Transcript_21261/g.22677 Transcript_21261/m.22677 type:complete len:120 (-) Transcript_21261:204-563(-)
MSAVPNDSSNGVIGSGTATEANAAITKAKASISNKTKVKVTTKAKTSVSNKTKKKDYAYRATWQHKLSRARNLAKRGGMTKKEMMKKHGRFPKKNEWWGPEEDEKEWMAKWKLENPQIP